MSTERIDTNATPGALKKMANLILRGIRFQEIAIAEALRLCAHAWAQERLDAAALREQLEQFEAESLDDTDAQVRPMTRLEHAAMDMQGELGRAEDRIRLLEELLVQGRAILSNDTNIRIQGDLVGQVTFGTWTERVDAALPASPAAASEEVR